MTGNIIRVVEGGGGQGIRRGNLVNGKVQDLRRMIQAPANPARILGFICEELSEEINAIAITRILGFICEELSEEINAIAITMAGKISNHTTVVHSPNLHVLDGCELTELVIQHSKLPCTIGNDMETAAIGEMKLRPNEPDFIIMTIGGGIGVKVVKNGRIVNPDAEIGHMKINPSPFAPVCGCGDQGCVEAEAGGKAVERKVLATCEALNITIPGDMNLCTFLDQEFIANKDWAIALYHQIALALGIMLANLQVIHKVPLLVIKGTFALKAFPLIENMVLANMEKNLSIDPSLKDLRIEESKDPEMGAMIGAADLFQYLKKEA